MEFRVIPSSSPAFQPWEKRSGHPEQQELDQYLQAAASPTAQLPVEKWPDRLSADDRKLIMDCVRSRKFLDAALRREWNWEVPLSWKPEDPLWKLALLNGEDFRTLHAAAGFLCAAPLIRKTIDRKTLTLLSNQYGQRYLDFALLRSSTLKVEIPESCKLETWSQDPSADIDFTALRCWSAAFADADPALKQRICLKGVSLQSDLPAEEAPKAIHLLETLAADFGIPNLELQK